MRVCLVTGAAIALVLVGCSGGESKVILEQVAVQWLQAKVAYDGGMEWDLEAFLYRAGRIRDEAVEEWAKERQVECPKFGDSGCLFFKGVEFEAIGQRPEGECRRVFVRTTEPSGKIFVGAVTVIQVDDQWLVRDWRALLSEDELEAGVARDCGVSG
jgi:hypothetical protein